MSGSARLLERLRERGWRVLHRVALGRFGFGSPVGRSVWERQYEQGSWDFLFSDSERAHYDAVVDFVREFAPANPRILDVGCGHGRLLELLQQLHFQSYVGMDVSAHAIERSKALRVPHASFIVGDFQAQPPEGTFDAIIFNESLYYALRPLRVARSFAARLSPVGCLVVSAVDFGPMAAVWNSLDGAFRTVAEKTVENTKSVRWTIKVLVSR